MLVHETHGNTFFYLHIRNPAQKFLAIRRRQDALLNVNRKDTEIWGNSLKKWKDSSVIPHGSNIVKDRYYENTQHYQDCETGKARKDVLRIKVTKCTLQFWRVKILYDVRCLHFVDHPV